MQITINIPSGMVTKVADAFANQYRYQEMVTNPDHDSEDPESEEMIENPVSKNAFAKGKVRDYIREIYVAGSLTEINEIRNASIKTIKTDSIDITEVD